MVYKPEPTDTSQITLPEELRNLTELLAKKIEGSGAEFHLVLGDYF